tara:strand:- start:959 stop:1846 length:888 start_codon:yes stop_codon:yes gene_type:complete
MSSILVTGGSGMVGKHLKEILPNATYISSKDGDLKDPIYVNHLLSTYSPKTVIHLAARVGGIQENINQPADFFDDNILMNTNMLKFSYKNNVENFIGVLSTCVYPDKIKNYPMTEKDMFLGPPTPTNFSYGYAKRCLAVQIEAYNKQYGTKYNYLIPSNLYSELDNFKHDTKMHFITSLLKKIKESEDKVKLLGTGKPLRQFMYAGDFARVIKEVVENNITESFNIACPENLTIDEMARIAIKELKPNLFLQYFKPELDGQYRKDVSCKKMKTLLPDFKFTPFIEGIKKVYDKIS